ncbi:MAG TPA: DoxX family protein [Flavisolibacter sp.]
MATTKKISIIYWSATAIIFLFEGVLPALTSQTQLAKEGIQHLGYPEYFGNAFVAFKVLGALALIVPKIPERIREWSYAGFAFVFAFACISHWAVDGFGLQTILPLFFLAILLISYVFHARLKQQQNHFEPTFKTNNYVISGVPG